MKKILSVLAVLFVAGTVNLFAMGVGAQFGANPTTNNGTNGAITFKVDSLPYVFAADAHIGEITEFGLSADLWLANPKIEKTWGYYYGVGVAGGFRIAENSSNVTVGARALIGTNIFLLDKFFEPYLQAAWQPTFVIGKDGGLEPTNMSVNLGFRFWF